MEEREAPSYCRLCEAGCGVWVQRDGEGVATAVRPAREHPVTRGFFCTKGDALVELLRDPERVTSPLRRTAGSAPGAFERVSWEQALDEIASKIAAIARESGPDSVAFYQGNPLAFSWAGAVATTALARVIGTGRFYTAGSIDCAERFVLADGCYGHPLLVTIPDLAHSRYVLLLGANPAISTWAQLTSIPRWREEVAQMRKAGGKFVVVDPRRTETADAADEHVSILPGADADLLLAMASVILRRGLENRAFLERHTSGLDSVRPRILEVTPESTEITTGIGAAQIERLAVEFATATSGCAVGHSGLTMSARGSLAEWAVILLNALCGRIDAPGGLIFNPGVLDLVRLGDLLLDRAAPLPEGVHAPMRRILDDVPAVGLTEALETGRARALLIAAGNPAVTFPNASRMRRALERADLLVSIDPQLNETSRLAHYVLPPLSMLEREDCVLLNSSFLSVPYCQWTAAVSRPPAGVRSEWWISRELARRLPRLPSREPNGPWSRRAKLRMNAMLCRGLLALGERRVLRMALAAKGQVTLGKVASAPHGVLLRPNRAGELLRRLRTPDRKVNLAPPGILDLFAREEAHATTPEFPLQLISRRRRGGMNSWLNGLPSARRVDPTLQVEIHPTDARRAGIGEGERVAVVSATGRFEGVATLSHRVRPGVVSAPHSLRERGASSFNDAVPDRPTDPWTGMPAYQGTPIRIEPARREMGTSQTASAP